MTAERRKVLLQPGFLLHLRPYGDTSAILELFTPEFGRVGVIARGVRAPRSRRRGLLQPFSELLLSWQGRGELGALTDVEAAGRPQVPVGRRLVSALYLNELLMRLLAREDPCPGLYQPYCAALHALANNDDEELALRVFERDLLAELGYGLCLDQDAQGQPIDPQLSYDYRLQQGPVPCSAAASSLGVSGAALIALRAGQELGAAQRRQVKRIMRAALAPHLGARPLKSRELYQRHKP